MEEQTKQSHRHTSTLNFGTRQRAHMLFSTLIEVHSFPYSSPFHNTPTEYHRYERARDIIIAINGTRIVNSDNLSSYLEENALPNQTINVTIVRNGQTMNVPLVLGA